MPFFLNHGIHTLSLKDEHNYMRYYERLKKKKKKTKEEGKYNLTLTFSFILVHNKSETRVL